MLNTKTKIFRKNKDKEKEQDYKELVKRLRKEIKEIKTEQRLKKEVNELLNEKKKLKSKEQNNNKVLLGLKKIVKNINNIMNKHYEKHFK